MDRHIANTEKLLAFLSDHEQIAWVKHPSLADHRDHDIAQRLMPKGVCSIISCGIKGGRAAGHALLKMCSFASHLANVGDAKTLVIHPGSTTHSHLTPEAMKNAGLTDDMIRISVGLEDCDDIIADFKNALRIAKKHLKGHKIMHLSYNNDDIFVSTGGRAFDASGEVLLFIHGSGQSHLTFLQQGRFL